ncbi:MAG: PDZ domain-containing protein [Candidatus Hydrogenedentes bacterium]|nr:PDZ domain-containing protein [Candidatus Hydrogenedentota bacterium]
MKSRLSLGIPILAAVAVALSVLLAVPAVHAQDSSARAAVDVAIAKVKPALVRIAVVWTDYGEGREQKYEAFGSGAIITDDGHVITNHHVAGHASRIFCTLATKEVIEADLVGTDPLGDIAILKLKTESGRIFPTAEFGDSSQVRVGDLVLAMGSPLSLSQSVTSGIISNTELIMPSRRWGSLTLDGEDVGSLVRWIGHDAEIFPGNSGGPLVNIRGQIIGINEISIGLGGAIPGNLAKEIAKQIIARGSVKRAWIGLEVQPQLRSTTDHRGVLIQGAIADSPAAQAGFQPGDLLLRLAGNEINVRFEEQVPLLNLLVSELPIGTPAEAVVLRGKEETKLTVTPIERERVDPTEVEIKEWGITARNISFVKARELMRDIKDGVLITSVRPGGPTGDAKPAVRDGDILTVVGTTPLKNVDQLRELTAKIVEGQTEPVATLVEYERRQAKMMTSVKVGIKEPPAPGREVTKAWLPVNTQVITRDIANQLNKPDLKGFRITQVYPGTVAETAGLKVGDLIYAVDGEPLEAANTPDDEEELSVLIRQYKIGTTAEFSILRDGQEVKVSVELPAAPQVEREMKTYADIQFEFTARDITFLDKVKEKWALDKTGVLVTKVESGGWASVGGMNVDDLIVSVDGVPTPDIPTLEARMKEVAQKRPGSVVFFVERGIHRAFVEIEPKWDAAPGAGKE